MQKDFITVTPDSGGSGSTTVTVAASANQTGSARSVDLTVAGGGMTHTVFARQAGVQYTITYKSNGSSEDKYFAFNSSSTPTGNPYQYIEMMVGGSDIEKRWSPDPGYLVDDVASDGYAHVYLKVGDTVCIRKMTGIHTGWSDSTTQSFILQASNQTVQLD